VIKLHRSRISAGWGTSEDIPVLVNELECVSVIKTARAKKYELPMLKIGAVNETLNISNGGHGALVRHWVPQGRADTTSREHVADALDERGVGARVVQFPVVCCSASTYFTTTNR
jgi:hypothetical protein